MDKISRIFTLIISFAGFVVWGQQKDIFLTKSTPIDIRYALEKSEAPLATYSLSGKIATLSGNIIETEVSLINTANGTTYTVETSFSNPEFTFINIPAGSYILKGVPISHQMYKITYFNYKELKADAFVIDLTAGNISEIVLYLIENPITDLQSSNYLETPELSTTCLDRGLEYKNIVLPAAVFNISGFKILDLFEKSNVINTESWKIGIYYLVSADGKIWKMLKSK